jgi:hypothetical protein
MDIEKRRKKAEYQKAWRANKKVENESIISKPILEVSLDNIDPLKKRPKKSKKIELKNSSVATYTSKLRAFHKRMTGLQLSQNAIDAIEGKEYDKKAIKDEFKYIESKIDYIKEHEINAIPNLCKIFAKFVGFAKLIKILTPMKWEIERGLSVRRNETTIKQDDIISFDKEDVIANALKLTDDYEKIMYLLMTLIPTRRLDDYRTMTYGVNEGNYFDDDYMYIKENSTKNKKSITIKIPTEIIDIIPHTGYILGYEYSQSALSIKFASVMEKIYKKKYGALDVRRMYLTTINNSGASFNERRDVADAVGHSINESIKYSMQIV